MDRASNVILCRNSIIFKQYFKINAYFPYKPLLLQQQQQNIFWKQLEFEELNIFPISSGYTDFRSVLLLLIAYLCLKLSSLQDIPTNPLFQQQYTTGLHVKKRRLISSLPGLVRVRVRVRVRVGNSIRVRVRVRVRASVRVHI